MSIINKEDRIEVVIDSKDRTAGTNENFTLTFTRPIGKVSRAEVKGATIPYTFYAVSSFNNVIDWSMAGTPYTASVAPGNYTVVNFITELKNAMNAVVAGFDITWSKTTYKLTITNATAFQILATSSSSIITGITTTHPEANSVTSDGIANVSGTPYILIKSSALTRPKVLKSYLNDTNDSVLYKVDITGAPGDYLVEKNLYSNLLNYGVRQTFRTIDFQLVDNNGNQLDLNGQPWSIVVIFVTS